MNLIWLRKARAGAQRPKGMYYIGEERMFLETHGKKFISFLLLTIIKLKVVIGGGRRED